MTTRFFLPIRSRLAVLAAALALIAPAARGEEAAGAAPAKPGCDHCARGAKAAAAEAGPAVPLARVEVADVTLVDQAGARRRLRDLAAGDRIVVLDTVFTTCTTVCPVLSAIMARLQERLGPEAKEVVFVSISIDPVRDTPERLAAFAAKFKARPGWTWLTGEPGDVEAALKGLGAYVANFRDHPPMILVGDGRKGEWTRFNGFPKQDQVLARVRELVAAREPLAARE